MKAKQDNVFHLIQFIKMLIFHFKKHQYSHLFLPLNLFILTISLIFLHTYQQTHTYTHKHTHKHTYTNTHTHKHTHKHTHTHNLSLSIHKPDEVYTNVHPHSST